MKLVWGPRVCWGQPREELLLDICLELRSHEAQQAQNDGAGLVFWELREVWKMSRWVQGLEGISQLTGLNYFEKRSRHCMTDVFLSW